MSTVYMYFASRRVIGRGGDLKNVIFDLTFLNY